MLRRDSRVDGRAEQDERWQDKLGAWAKNMLHHHGQVPEDPEKVQENEGGGGAVEEEEGDCSEAPG